MLAGCCARPLSSRSQTAASAWKKFLIRASALGSASSRSRLAASAAGQAVERGGALFAASFRLFAFAQLRSEMPDDERDHEIRAEHHEVVQMRDVKSEARRNEQEIPEQRAEQRRERASASDASGWPRERPRANRRARPPSSRCSRRSPGRPRSRPRRSPGQFRIRSRARGPGVPPAFLVGAGPIHPTESCECRCCRCGA